MRLDILFYFGTFYFKETVYKRLETQKGLSLRYVIVKSNLESY